MIQSLDPVGPGPRLDPSQLLVRGPIIDAEQARALGLRNGQVVQAVINHSGTAFSVIWPSGQRVGLPTALDAFPLPSNWRWASGSRQELLALLMPGGHILLKPVKPGPNAANAPAATASPSAAAFPSATTATATPATAAPSAKAMGAATASPPSTVPAAPASPLIGAAAASASGTAYTLGQAFAAAQGIGSGAGTGPSAELARLMQQAPAWSSLMRLLQGLSQPEGSNPGESAQTALPPALAGRLGELLGSALPRMGQLSEAALRQAIARGGLGTEAALMAGAAGLDHDLKAVLRRLSRQPPAGVSGLESTLSRAVDTLERSQIDTLSAQMQGQVLLSLVIPFGDAGPVALRIFRESRRQGEDEPPFVVDVHSAYSALGPVWLRTQVAHDQRVSLTMWALRPEVAQQARDQSRGLRLNLHQSGLKLASLDILAGAPMAGQVAFAPEGLQA